MIIFKKLFYIKYLLIIHFINLSMKELTFKKNILKNFRNKYTFDTKSHQFNIHSLLLLNSNFFF